MSFANGSFGYDEQVRAQSPVMLPWSPPPPTTAFWQVLATAEAIRLNLASTDAQVQAARYTLQTSPP